ncbi:MarR family transcriptional regulator [Paeniglutamicibacter sp. NPDC091659]|uniref:MarR family transcriptional regulator n=1 Tax=Paeniglutamicibacter sp. NPDC091659 TaxID=3364389 RepID=UPI00381C0AAC
MSVSAVLQDDLAVAVRLRNREVIDHQDFLRAIHRASKHATQVEIAKRLGISQPAVSKVLKSAAKVADPVAGFSGATPFEIAQRFAAGELTRAEVLDELGRWDYAPLDETDGYDSLLVNGPGTTNDIARARRANLIDWELYEEILGRVEARLAD